MEILLLAAELAPFNQTTDAAETTAALAKSLEQQGHHVTLVVPYSSAYEEANLLVARRLTPLDLGQGRTVTVFDSQLSSGVGLVLLGLPPGCDAPLVPSAVFSPDSAISAACFALAVAELLVQRNRQGTLPDVIQAVDCGAALIGLALERAPLDQRPPVVLAVTDADWAGRVPDAANAKDRMDIPLLQDPRAWNDGQLCLLGAGLMTAGAVVVPSESYAASLTQPGATDGAAVLFGSISDKLFGILPGLDYARINPASDSLIAARYDAEDPDLKGATRLALLNQLKLDPDPRPVLLAPGPLTEAAGGDWLVEALPELVHREMVIVALGNRSDRPELRDQLAALAARAPGDLGFIPDADQTLLHRGFAAADLVILPSRREPLGWRQLFAQRYGAAPIARAVGAHVDSIVDADASLDSGTGFLYDEPGPKALIAAVERGVAATRSKNFARFRRRLMRRDVGWDRPVRRHLQIYRQLSKSAS